MDDRQARLAYVFALVPLSVAVWGLSVVNDVRIAAIASTVVSCVFVLLIWRRYVRWNARRAVGTFSWTALVIAQVLLWVPLWDISGCGWNDALCMAQSSTAYGLWCVACALTWWGFSIVTGRRRATVADSTGKYFMTPNAVRMALAFALVPLLPGLFWLSVMTERYFWDGSGDNTMYRAFTVCAAVAILIWWLLWRRCVIWTPGRVWATAALSAFLLASPASIYLPDGDAWLSEAGAEVWNSFRGVCPYFAAALFFAGTARIWRADPDRGGARAIEALARCPECDYSLKGLSEVRCPECGWRTTVDGVVADCVRRLAADA